MGAFSEEIVPPSLRKLWIYGVAAAAAWLGSTFWQLMNGWWLINGTGRPLATNVLCFWSAGRMALAGQAAAIYDPQALGAMEHAEIAGDFTTMSWCYPPTFLLTSLCLAGLPYLWACGTWLVVTGIGYVAAIRAILPYRLGAVLALAAPVVLINTALTETGFAIAALAGVALIWLEERPILAGIALGCLTFKPQFGLLFPLVLMATGRWRVFFSATATALGLAALTALLVGGEVWSVFFQSLPTIGNHIIGDRPSFDGDGVDWWNIQTWHAVARVLGAGNGIGWSIYAVTAVSLAVAMCLLWRSAAAFELKAAALASASFLATPYVMVYDATLMVVAVAFLIRHGLVTGFRRGDIGICVFALFSPLYLLVWWGGVPLLPLACTILLIWIIRRALSETARPIIVEPAIAR